MEFADVFDAQPLRAPDFASVLINVALGLLIAAALSWHYQRYARVFTNKARFSRVFVGVMLTTLLIVSAVKTSLALSLGLVGALSIIRFRTPIKEPEDLVYLFLALAVGIGLGANQQIITVAVVAILLGFMTLRGQAATDRVQLRTVLQIAVPRGGDQVVDSGGALVERLISTTDQLCRRVDLQRFDSHPDEFNASFLVDIPDRSALSSLLDRIQDAIPGAAVSIIEREGLA